MTMNRFFQARRILLVCGCLLSAVLPAESQVVKKYTVSGKVFAAGTSEPLNYVNVFLNNTSLGAVTDMYGQFTIKGVPAGTFELVASMIGYERQIKTIELSFQKHPGSQLFLLKQTHLHAPMITVTAKRNRSLDKDYRLFSRILLGTGAAAQKCTIVNPEVLSLTTAPLYTLRASAAEPLKVRNRYLGYEISYFIDQFDVQTDGRLLFTGSIRFDELVPDGPGQRDMYRENRISSYSGSMEHFFRALIEKRAAEAGFAVYALSGSPLAGQAPVLRALDPDTLVTFSAGRADVELYLPEWTKIVYYGEGESRHYARELRNQTGIRETYANQVSYLNVQMAPLICARSGHPLFPNLVVRYGRWAFDRLADMLPMDYAPDFDNLQSTAGLDSLPAPLLIRRGIEMAVSDSLVAGSRYFYRGLSRLGSVPFADTLFRELTDLLSDREKDSFARAADKGEMLRHSFERRDPSPATPENERIRDHWQRLVFARRSFPAGNTRGYDDRGMIYVRYGQPFARRKFPASGMLAGSESWVYHRFGGETVFDFVVQDGFRLMKSFREITAGGLNLPGWRQVKSFINDRTSFSGSYRSMLSEELTAFSGFTSNRGEQQEPVPLEAFQVLEREYRYKIKAAQQNLPESAAEYTQRGERLFFSAARARFFRHGRTEVDIVLAIPFEAMKSNADSSASVYPLRIAYALRDESGAVIAGDDRRLFAVQPDPRQDHYRTRLQIPVESAAAELALELQAPAGGRNAERIFKLQPFAAPAGEMFLSDLQVCDSLSAEDLQSAAGTGAEGSRRPSAFDRISTEMPLQVYGEVYQLSTRGGNQASLTGSWSVFSNKKKSVLDRLNIFKREKPLRTGLFEQAAVQPVAGMHLSVPAAGLDPGEYRLTVKVKDDVSGREEERSLTFTVFKQR